MQAGIGETVLALADGMGQAAQRGARHGAREQAIADVIKHVEQLGAAGEALGAAGRGIADALEGKKGIEGGEGAGTRHARGPGRIVRLAAVATAVPLALQAQTGAAHQVELGAFGSYTHYDATATNLAGRSGAGGRLGYYFSRLLSLEADGDYTVTRFNPAGADVSVSRVGGSLLFHARAMGLYLGAGYERLFYRGAAVTQNDGGHLVLGSLMNLGGRAGFRVEGRVSYLPGGTVPGTGATSHPLNFGVNVGRSRLAFGGPGRDTDHDGGAHRPAAPARRAAVPPRRCSGDPKSLFGPVFLKAMRSTIVRIP